MHDLSLLPHDTIDEKVEYYEKYFENEGKNYNKKDLKDAIEYLSYKSAPKDLPKDESDKHPTLYIFRHAQTEDNTNFIFSGWRDSKLTDKGKEQAMVLSDKLKDKKIDRVYSSPQIRAIDTLKIALSKNEMAKILDVEVDPRLKERSYGIYQGHSKLEVHMKSPKALLSIRRSFSARPPEGESIADVCIRVADFCEELVEIMKKEKVNVAVSCHGNTIRGFRKYFEGLSDEETAHLETPLGQDYIAYIIR